ncbi:NADPH:quinone oxidoreductase family protein [Aurantiacibacter zhengii]|uniref:NADPH:quinone oxidoreductase family protein n=1 Tax=Aurantiacibacter zhengii TaxID=2307003 RepID=A0A418NQC4_9SPHN|nr:NADPH:quinone oxidoreductase family protein [Aurantiacibacter zhengii]RIV85004.1 NADPH:quinone oxidoreductase family protein [Aurantiacibacter zhengii]
MKALYSTAPGGPDTLELTEMEAPQPGKGELAVRVLACAINYPDVLIIEDKYQLRPPRPFAPGAEFAGEVIGLGEGVEGWAVGDRLIAVRAFGGLAEQVTIDAGSAFLLPAGADPVEGSALLMTYATTIHALKDRGELREGQTLLVLGAAGGVGLAAIQIGKAMGARVIAAVSSEDKAEAAKAAGADETMIYGRAPFDKDASKALAASFKEAVGPGGADVIYDPVGGDYCEPALRSIAWEGRYLVIGFPAGIPKLPLNLTLLKSCDVRGVFWGGFVARDPQTNAAHVRQLLDWWQDGTITPHIDCTFPLEQGGEAIRRLAERKAVGKVVVTMA